MKFLNRQLEPQKESLLLRREVGEGCGLPGSPPSSPPPSLAGSAVWPQASLVLWRILVTAAFSVVLPAFRVCWTLSDSLPFLRIALPLSPRSSLRGWGGGCVGKCDGKRLCPGVASLLQRQRSGGGRRGTHGQPAAEQLVSASSPVVKPPPLSPAGL